LGAFFDLDRWQEIWVTITHNKSRSFEIKQRITDENAEPSAWIKGTDKTYKTSESLIVPAGQYILAVAITDDTQNQKPGLNLAVKNGKFINDWLQIGTIQITK
jgi:hypothetical protein